MHGVGRESQKGFAGLAERERLKYMALAAGSLFPAAELQASLQAENLGTGTVL